MAHTNGIGSSTLLQTLMTQTDAVSFTGKKDGTVATAAAARVAQDRTQLSTTASALQQTSTDDVRTGKVQALQSAIAAGTYKVSASDVADSVIRSLLR